MAKRVSEPLRNLDDSLRVFHVLTFRSCGVVLAFFSLCHGLEWQFKVWTLFLGSLSFAFELALAGALALLLAWIEHHDDEFFVPSAVAFYADALFQRLPPLLLLGRLAGAVAVFLALDVAASAHPSAGDPTAPLALALPACGSAAWLASRSWRFVGMVVFSGAAASRRSWDAVP
jgi:hypothetical protein